MADPGKEGEVLSGESSWFADILGDGSNIAEQLKAVKAFAYQAFDKLDIDQNGFISHEELEATLKGEGLQPRERMFVTFLLDNHDQIADAFDERTIADGISRKDLEFYFDLVATLL
jgi:hypothetical protein